MDRRIDRRMFIKATVAGSLSAAIGAPVLIAGAGNALEEKEEWRNKTDGMKYRKLGRTDFMVSEIGMGGTGINANTIAILELAIEKGLNYIDTARGYGRGASEEAVGKFLKEKKLRDKVFITTKGGSEKDLDASLKVLQVESIDVYMIHGAERPASVANDAVAKMFEKAKKAGKIRFAGVSSHTNIAETLKAAIEAGWCDVIMPGYNAANAADLEDLLKLAKEKSVGVVGMKGANAEWTKKNYGKDLFEEIAKVAKDSKLNKYQTCYKWILSHDAIAAVIPPMTNRKMLEEDIAVPNLELS